MQKIQWKANLTEVDEKPMGQNKLHGRRKEDRGTEDLCSKRVPVSVVFGDAGEYPSPNSRKVSRPGGIVWVSARVGQQEQTESGKENWENKPQSR